MGCWNGTCGFSNLPIMAGQRVRGYLIALPPTTDSTGFCYSNEAGYPVGLPFKGQYNDYGGIENINPDLTTKLMAEWFGVSYVDLEDWLNDDIMSDGKVVFDVHKKTREFRADPRYRAMMADTQKEHDEETKAQIKTHEDRMAAYYDTKPKLALFLVHEPIFQAMANAQPRYRQKAEMGALHLAAAVTDAIEQAKIFIEPSKGQTELLENEILDQLDRGFLDPFTHASRTWIEDPNDLDSQGKPKRRCYDNPLAIMMGGSGFAGSAHPKETMEPFRNWIVNQVLKGQPIDELIPDLVDHHQVNACVEMGRRIWYPQSGRGSQSENFMVHVVMHDAALKLAKTGLKAERAWRKAAGYTEDEDE